jgi:serine/threonine-protein kinase
VSEEVTRIAEALPDYLVTRELGRGGMGVVFLGRHRRLDRGVAIKELPATIASEPEVRDRFSSEARTLATLSHPHIVPIYDYVEREALCLIVMEELPGGTVWDRFTTAGLTPPTACAITMACCAALQHAHDKGVLHLDVKPDNLMFDRESAVKVTDFGISRVISGDRTLATVDGQVLGTPAYMSPEQARAAELTPASDVYATGVMLYELLSGHLPWHGAETASELLALRLKEPPTPLREIAPHVPQELADVVMRALERDPADRYARAEDFGIAIGEACATAWGPNWLDHAGVAIVGSERLSIAARTTGGRTAAPAPASTRATGTGTVVGTVVGTGAQPAGAGATSITGPAEDVPRAAETAMGMTAAPAEPRAGETVVVGATGAPATDQPVDTGSPPPSAPPAAGGPAAVSEFQVVRAAGAEPRIRGADINQLQLADLVGVEDIFHPPPRPWPAIAIGVALLAAAASAAIVGIGTPDRSGTLRGGQVQVAGHDVVRSDRIAVDLSENVPVAVRGRALAGVDDVELSFSVLGVPLGTSKARVQDGRALIDPGLEQRTVAGYATAEVTLFEGDEERGSQEFGADATQPWFFTLTGIGGLLLVLLAVANLESSLKPLRPGHYRIRSGIGAALSGAIAGFGLVVISGALGLAEPTVASVVVTAVLAAGAGVAATFARVRSARRRRLRRAVRRAEKNLGVRVSPN